MILGESAGEFEENLEEFEDEIEKDEHVEKKFLTDEEILAIDIVNNSKNLAVILSLKEPKTSTELISVKVCKNGKLTSLSQSSMFNLLKKLKELRVVEVFSAVDRRKRYYRLTDFGKNVYNHVEKLIYKVMKDYIEVEVDEEKRIVKKKICKDIFDEIALRDLKIDPEILHKAIAKEYEREPVYVEVVKNTSYGKFNQKKFVGTISYVIVEKEYVKTSYY